MACPACCRPGGAAGTATTRRTCDWSWLRLPMCREERRGAAFVCAAAFVDASGELLAEGRMAGQLVSEPRGANGFGYDPIFVADGKDLTNGELAPERQGRDQPSRPGLARIGWRASTPTTDSKGSGHECLCVGRGRCDQSAGADARSSVGRRVRLMWRSTSCTAVFAIPTCTRRAMSGVARVTRSFLATRLSAG